ncbi:DUF3080 family protein [Alteromonas sp. a30]|uniref:DUF3080 family protein n=1 Tax=Alteromonas sp. a30 TaxID=2730917 RepID=UPI00228292F1|nr:DUF3080 family protein [Alteromonas sp. a30]MCY7296370.1 DUF3080 family protein [Alteromonas sp. a30]
MLLLLASCTPKPEVIDTFETYTQRLANILETAPPELYEVTEISESHPLTHAKIHQLPNISALPLASEQSKLTLKDFYALPNCGTLKSIIAEHNTSLGRVQDQALQFLYHDKLLNALNACVLAYTSEKSKILSKSETRENKETQGLIETLTNLKIEDKRISWRNLLYTDKSLRAALYSPAILMPDDTQAYSLSLSEFNYLQHVSQSEFFESKTDAKSEAKAPTQLERTITQSDLLNALKHIAQQKLPARLWNSFSYYRANFQRLNAFLNSELRNLDCTTPKGKKQTEYLSNVMRLFFIEKIQPLASALNKQHYQLSPMLSSIYTMPNANPEFDAFLQTQTKMLFEQYQQALLDHVKIWQEVFKQCGVKVGLRKRL